MEKKMTSNKSMVGLAALAIGAALATAPLDFGLAKPGGGAGGGNGAGHGEAASAAAAANASATAAANANANSAVSAATANQGSVSAATADEGGVNATTQGSLSSQLGGLNAAHASKAALSHANPRSRVGRIATYAHLNATAPSSTNTVNALNAAANKTPVTSTTRNALNSLIGNKAAIKDDVTRTTDKDGANRGAVSSRLGALNAAHASKSAFSHASPNSRVGKIAAYARDNAVSPNSQTTTKALNAAANKTPVSTETRENLDGLIGSK
jgi:hypothetical protein